jgi:DNA-binding CsgD family transcriptional regulator
MLLDQALASLRASKADSTKLELAAFHFVTSAWDSSKVAIAEAAAVPHWFDAKLLEELAEAEPADVAATIEALGAAQLLERVHARSGWSLRERLRAAIRQRLLTNSKPRLATLSERAVVCFPGDESASVAERIYHELFFAPVAAFQTLRATGTLDEESLSHVLAQHIEELALEDSLSFAQKNLALSLVSLRYKDSSEKGWGSEVRLRRHVERLVGPWRRAAELWTPSADEDSVPLSDLWRQLVEGRKQIVDHFSTTTQFCVVVRDLPMRERLPLTGRSLAICEASLQGESAKHLAIELGIAPSTVSAHLHRGFMQLGLPASQRDVPAILFLSASAARLPSSISARRRTTKRLGLEMEILSIARPELTLQSVLSPAQFQVLGLLAEGHSYSEIARLRGTSPRTVANLVSSVYKQLDVQGRGDVLRAALSRAATRGDSWWSQHDERTTTALDFSLMRASSGKFTA